MYLFGASLIKKQNSDRIFRKSVLCILPAEIFVAEAPEAMQTEKPELPVKGVPGDFDGSGTVNVQYAIMIFRAAMGFIDSPAVLPKADTDGGGTVSVQEAISALRNAVSREQMKPQSLTRQPLASLWRHFSE